MPTGLDQLWQLLRKEQVKKPRAKDLICISKIRHLALRHKQGSQIGLPLIISFDPNTFIGSGGRQLDAEV